MPLAIWLIGSYLTVSFMATVVLVSACVAGGRFDQQQEALRK